MMSSIVILFTSLITFLFGILSFIFPEKIINLLFITVLSIIILRIISNLISNSMRYLKSNGKITIEITSDDNNYLFHLIYYYYYMLVSIYNINLLQIDLDFYIL